MLFTDNKRKSHALFNLCVQVNLATVDQELKRNPRSKEDGLDCRRIFRLGNDMVPSQFKIYEQVRYYSFSVYSPLRVEDGVATLPGRWPETRPGCELMFKEAIEIIHGDLMDMADALTVYKGSSW